jgi:hypothetical protein
MKILKVTIGCNDEIQDIFVGVKGDLCVTAHCFSRSVERCNHEKKEVRFVDLYGLTVHDQRDLGLPKEVLETLTLALQGSYDTSKAVEVETSRRPFTPEEIEMSEAESQS